MKEADLTTDIHIYKQRALIHKIRWGKKNRNTCQYNATQFNSTTNCILQNDHEVESTLL